MVLNALSEFFQWAVLISFLIYLFSAAMGIFARDFVYRLHSKWFNLQRPTFDILIYSYIGLFKVLWILFFLVPYLALIIISS